jgi:hypothetical protein
MAAVQQQARCPAEEHTTIVASCKAAFLFFATSYRLHSYHFRTMYLTLFLRNLVERDRQRQHDMDLELQPVPPRLTDNSDLIQDVFFDARSKVSVEEGDNELMEG